MKSPFEDFELYDELLCKELVSEPEPEPVFVRYQKNFMLFLKYHGFKRPISEVSNEILDAYNEMTNLEYRHELLADIMLDNKTTSNIRNAEMIFKMYERSKKQLIELIKN